MWVGQVESCKGVKGWFDIFCWTILCVIVKEVGWINWFKCCLFLGLRKGI